MVQPDSIVDELDGFTIKYRLAPSVVVFSHGFGVRRDARGMFTDIVNSLPKHVGYVLFEYNDNESNATRLTGLSEQVNRLNSVTAWTKRQPDVERLAVVAHSKGCTVTALSGAEYPASAIMLAPPLHVGSSIRTRFTTRPNAVKQGNTWTIPRSDGTFSIIDEVVLDELDSTDGEAIILAYAQKQPVHLVIAADDEVLPAQDYSRVAACPVATMVTIASADHNFTGQARGPLVSYVTQQLHKDLTV